MIDYLLENLDFVEYSLKSGGILLRTNHLGQELYTELDSPELVEVAKLQIVNEILSKYLEEMQKDD